MPKFLAVLPVLLALGACGGESHDPAASRASETAAPPAGVDPAADANVAPAAEQVQAAAEFPPDVRLDGTTLLVEERNYLTRSQAKRRRTTYQFSDASPSDVAADLQRRFLAAGYREREEEDRGDGMIRHDFAKAGVGRVAVRVRPDVEVPLLPAATGEVFLDWQVAPGTGDDDADPGEEAGDPDVAAD